MSAATITKRAEELRRGDVITDFLRAASFLGNAVVVNSYSCGSVGVCDVAGNVTRIMLGYDTSVQVEAPALSPAQQHADALAALVREAKRGNIDDAWHGAATNIIDLIDPPAPPTLEEALDALQAAHDYLDVRGMGHTKVESILDRAKRAGVLKP